MTGARTIPALILGGGLSRRMGEDKTQALINGVPLLQHIARRLEPQVAALAINFPPDHPLASLYPNLPDTIAGRPGPLAGVHAGLQAFSATTSHLLTVPGDAPFLPENLVERLSSDLQAEEIVVAASNGREHPVVALWPTSLAAELQVWLTNPDQRRVTDFIRRHRWRVVDFDLPRGTHGEIAIDPFFNINTPTDLALARAIIAGGKDE